jgi:uncharacterized repeat protein (TIGR01451 family)
MTTDRRQIHRRTRVRCLVLLVGLIALATGGSAQAALSGPQLSIAIDNGKTSVRAGDTVTYAIVVTNVGTTPVEGLWVSQSLPTGLRPLSSDSRGVTGHGVVSWRVDLAVSAEATMHTTMRVTRTPTDLLRLAPVACASATRTGRPIVCASHSDQLPAGAAAQSAADTASTGSPGLPVWAYAVGVAVPLAVVVLVLYRRRTAATA